MNYQPNRVSWNLFDKLIVIYCLFNIGFIIVFGRPLANYYDEIFFYISVAALSSLIVYFLDENKSNWQRFLRLFYPGILFTFFYRETSGMIHILFDDFFDYQIVAFERTVLGINPTIYIDQYLLEPILNEIFMMTYFLYYFLILWFMLSLYIKNDYKILNCGQIIKQTISNRENIL